MGSFLTCHFCNKPFGKRCYLWKSFSLDGRERVACHTCTPKLKKLRSKVSWDYLWEHLCNQAEEQPEETRKE